MTIAKETRTNRSKVGKPQPPTPRPFIRHHSPETIRKGILIYTINTIESLNFSVRKITKNRQSFPSTDAAMKLIFMALQNISKRWTMPIRD